MRPATAAERARQFSPFAVMAALGVMLVPLPGAPVNTLPCNGALALLPVVYMALYGTRTQLAVVIGGVAAVWVLQLLVIGAPMYPVAGWRGCVLSVGLSAMVGTTVQRLVAKVRSRDREREELLGRLRAQALSSGTRARPAPSCRRMPTRCSIRPRAAAGIAWHGASCAPPDRQSIACRTVRPATRMRLRPASLAA